MQLADLQIGDVAHPDLVRCAQPQLELLIAGAPKVALDARAGIANRRHARLDAVAPHEPRYAVLSNPMAAIAQHPVHPRTAVDPLAFGVNRLDLAGEQLVAALTLATLARAPGIKTRPRNPIDPAHQCQIVLRPVYFDEGEDFRFRSEANRMAFFKSSCSSLSTL